MRKAVQHGTDMIKIRLDAEDAKHSVTAAQAPDSPLVDDDLDDLSTEDISVERMEDKLDCAEIIQIDCNMEAISRHIDTLKRPELTAHPEAISRLQDMIRRLVIRRTELEHGTRPPPYHLQILLLLWYLILLQLVRLVLMTYMGIASAPEDIPSHHGHRVIRTTPISARHPLRHTTAWLAKVVGTMMMEMMMMVMVMTIIEVMNIKVCPCMVVGSVERALYSSATPVSG
jgi:hypothetical protein